MTTNAPATRDAHPDPLVSVVVPVYNGDRYLRESLDSLTRQTYANVEIIVVDDASTDASAQIIASYADAIRTIRQPRNSGIYAAANAGIERARGEFIAVYHADDVYDARIVEREAAFLREHPEAGAVFCLDIFVDAENREYDRLRLPADLRGRPLLRYEDVLDGLLRYKNRFLMCPGAMVRASAYRELGTYRQERFRNTSDVEMWLRIARRFPLGLLEEYLFRYRHFHGNSSQRYHHLRTAPENFFMIVDLYLSEDGRGKVSGAALDAYEGHRQEDQLRIAVSHYIKGDLDQCRATLAGIRVARILRGATLQRGRLLLLLFAFRVLSRLPRVGPVADFFLQRWFVKRAPRTVQ